MCECLALSTHCANSGHRVLAKRAPRTVDLGSCCISLAALIATVAFGRCTTPTGPMTENQATATVADAKVDTDAQCGAEKGRSAQEPVFDVIDASLPADASNETTGDTSAAADTVTLAQPDLGQGPPGCPENPPTCGLACDNWGWCARCPYSNTCQPTPNGCWKSLDCKVSGSCWVWGGGCQALPTAAQPCAKSWACSAVGHCGDWPDGTCKATTEVGCQTSKSCAMDGRCDQLAGHPHCVPMLAAHCEQSVLCKEEGACSVYFSPKELYSQHCVPQTTQHCLQSAGCTQSGNCTLNSKLQFPACVSTTGDCTKGCAEFGTCALDSQGRCVPTEAKHCENATVCKVSGKCIQLSYSHRCLSADELFHL